MADRTKDTVNLDGLIPREDLDSKVPGTARGVVVVSELHYDKHFYGLLRKPHFQRETDDWNVDNVVSLIRSFRDGQLIPAVILWSAQGYIFVIDGAHRLSVFIAWVNDDYGDRERSRAFFRHEIPKRQLEIARKCRDAIRAEGLEYAELSSLTKIPNRTDLQMKWSSAINEPVEAQWVRGDAATALQSFLDINQRAVAIDKTERYMIEQRKAPTVIAARAIVNAARGHQYWGDFESQHISTIEAKARGIYDAIFEPENAQPHKDADLQPAGAAHTANGLRLTLDLVHLLNGVSGRGVDLGIDKTGDATVEAIEKTHAIVKRIGGHDHGSLGLYPAVYFWGETGNHRPTIFLAVAALIQEMISKDELRAFTIHRAAFEEHLVGGGAVKRILSRHGGWKKSLVPTMKMLRTLLDGLFQGMTEPELESALQKLLVKKQGSEADNVFSRFDTWRETRAALRIKASLDSAPRCSICKARMVLAHASSDHKIRRADGGGSRVEDAQLTHQYCNTGFKSWYEQRGLEIPEIDEP